MLVGYGKKKMKKNSTSVMKRQQIASQARFYRAVTSNNLKIASLAKTTRKSKKKKKKTRK